jgi:hypothetical protein
MDDFTGIQTKGKNITTAFQVVRFEDETTPATKF